MLIFNKETGQVSKEKVRVPEDHEVAWIRLRSPDKEEVRHVLETLFHCHPLLIEDCIKLNQRPKLDRYKSNIFMTFFAVQNKEFIAREMGMVVGSNYVITIYKDEIPFLEDVYKDFLEIEGRMEHAGEILYHVLDRCVDEYNEVVSHFENMLDKLERGIYRNPYIRVSQDIFRLKRQLHSLRRIFNEEKTILGTISHQNFQYTRPETDVYFSDIYDHISRVIDSIDIFRDSLTGLLELQMSMKSDRMNEIMKTLTVFSTFFMPLTFIVGLYGMNFKDIPEYNWNHGYLYVWIVMILVALGMWYYFKRKRWW